MYINQCAVFMPFMYIMLKIDNKFSIVHSVCEYIPFYYLFQCYFVVDSLLFNLKTFVSYMHKTLYCTTLYAITLIMVQDCRGCSYYNSEWVRGLKIEYMTFPKFAASQQIEKWIDHRPRSGMLNAVYTLNLIPTHVVICPSASSSECTASKTRMC